MDKFPDGSLIVPVGLPHEGIERIVGGCEVVYYSDVKNRLMGNLGPSRDGVER